MIKVENSYVYGWEAAIRGMRNPMNSWSKSDSVDGNLGENDLALMRKLSRAGSDHAKFRRMITVTMDIVAPLYWWKEFDTYKVGTVANSCSTMHKIHEREFVLEDFSCGYLIRHDLSDVQQSPLEVLEDVIITLNFCRERFIATHDKKWWWQMIQLLPSSYNQKRTVLLNYEVLSSMYKARKDHKLDEWLAFCTAIEMLPYSEIITGGGADGER